MIEALERLHQVVNDRHQYAQQWKQRTGGKVMGYFCTYVPEEIIYATGTLPVRILGSHEPPDITDTHIYGMFCSFCRDCLAQGLKGRYGYLDGLTYANTCIHISQAFYSWVKHVPLSYSHYIFMPTHLQSRYVQSCLVHELTEFKRSLQDWTGKSITNQDLDKAIEVYNTNRRLLRQVYEHRRQEPPTISAAEALETVLSSMLMDKAEHNQLLQQLLVQLPGRKNEIRPGTRLMVLGSVNDDIAFLKFAESLGTNIVIDELCTGTRYFWNDVVPQEDRLSAIADRYIQRPPCPHKDLLERRRLTHVLGLAKDYNVQGAIIIQLKFCDPHNMDIPSIQAMLKDNNIPSLFLEYDIIMPPGQFRTRLEAFLETLQLEII